MESEDEREKVDRVVALQELCFEAKLTEGGVADGNGLSKDQAAKRARLGCRS